jgi:hypothetical protein
MCFVGLDLLLFSWWWNQGLKPAKHVHAVPRGDISSRVGFVLFFKKSVGEVREFEGTILSSSLSIYDKHFPTIFNFQQIWAHYFSPSSLIAKKEHHSRQVSLWIVINHFGMLIKRNTAKCVSLQRGNVANAESHLKYSNSPFWLAPARKVSLLA